jgi:tRNA threonylcarbamoyl adenosine modification protein YeaZ
MRILGLEFSTPLRSVALVEKCGESGPICRAEIQEGGDQGRSGLVLVDEVLQKAGVERETVDCIAIGLGPGSYTGIRSAIALGHGWNSASQVVIRGISSVEGLMAQAQAQGEYGLVHVVLDALRQEYYVASYHADINGYEEVEPLRLISQEAINLLETKEASILGPAVSKWFNKARVAFPMAAWIAQLACRRIDACPQSNTIEPIYLRKTEFVKAPPLRKLPE